jgi:hypothetical protein
MVFNRTPLLVLLRASALTGLFAASGAAVVAAQDPTPDQPTSVDSIGPFIRFSDLESGPNTGGENNKGAFVTIYGKGFGDTRGASLVTVGGGLVDNYRIWSDGKVAFQLGPGAATGNILVTVAGVPSNTLPFTVRPGNIYFVSTSGSDTAAGTFSAPWRTLIKAKNTMAAGDITYAMNGVSQTVQDPNESAWRTGLLLRRSGTAGRPIALVAYPGATVTVGTPTLFSAIRTAQDGTEGNYWVVAGLVLRASEQGMESLGGFKFSRLVANDISCPNGNGLTGCIGIAFGNNVKLLGNDLHDTGRAPASSKLYHAVYIGENTNHVEIAWNNLHNNRTCYSLLFHSSGQFNQFDLSVHDNLIHHDNCAAINFATVDPSQGRVEAYNNVMYEMGSAATPPDGMGANGCIYVPGYTYQGPASSGYVEAYNNTCYNVGSNTAAGSSSGAYLRTAGDSPNLYLRLRNNVTSLAAGQRYLASANGASLLVGSNNLWYGVGNGPSGLTGNVNADPRFVDVAGRNLRLQSTSPAIDAGFDAGLTRDFDGNLRVVTDIGAFEYASASVIPNLSIGDVTVTEGNSGTRPASFSVFLSQATDHTVSVNYATAANTATAGTDYQSASGTVSIPPGGTTATVTVNVVGDTVDEPNETFWVNLSSLAGATIGDGQGVGTITDDDAPAAPLMVSPAPGSTLTSPKVTFTWTAGTGVSRYAISVGSAFGVYDIFRRSGTALSQMVTGLPTDGRTLYVRLRWRIDGRWYGQDYTYTAPGS